MLKQESRNLETVEVLSKYLPEKKRESIYFLNVRNMGSKVQKALLSILHILQALSAIFMAGAVYHHGVVNQTCVLGADFGYVDALVGYKVGNSSMICNAVLGVGLVTTILSFLFFVLDLKGKYFGSTGELVRFIFLILWFIVLLVIVASATIAINATCANIANNLAGAFVDCSSMYNAMFTTYQGIGNIVESKDLGIVQAGVISGWVSVILYFVNVVFVFIYWRRVKSGKVTP